VRRLAALAAVLLCAAAPASHAADKPPNILVIFGDDIGMWNVGAYTHGMMGRTPNIDRIAKEGALFTDHYGQPSCTAGRAAFIMGQLPVRTGMTTVGIPGSTRGIQKEAPTLAEVLKSAGYNTAQFGKNQTYPSVPYVFNLLMDPMEKMDPESHEWGYIGRKFVAEKLWAPTAASRFLQAHLKSLQEFPPRQGADTLSMRKAIEDSMKKLDNPAASSN